MRWRNWGVPGVVVVVDHHELAVRGGHPAVGGGLHADAAAVREDPAASAEALLPGVDEALHGLGIAAVVDDDQPPVGQGLGQDVVQGALEQQRAVLGAHDDRHGGRRALCDRRLRIRPVAAQCAGELGAGPRCRDLRHLRRAGQRPGQPHQDPVPPGRGRLAHSGPTRQQIAPELPVALHGLLRPALRGLMRVPCGLARGDQRSQRDDLPGDAPGAQGALHAHLGVAVHGDRQDGRTSGQAEDQRVIARAHHVVGAQGAPQAVLGVLDRTVGGRMAHPGGHEPVEGLVAVVLARTGQVRHELHGPAGALDQRVQHDRVDLSGLMLLERAGAGGEGRHDPRGGGIRRRLGLDVLRRSARGRAVRRGGLS